MENQLLLALKNNKLLKNVDIAKINLQNIKGKLVTLNEGGILFRESDPANSIFLVASGEINLVRKKLLGRTRSLILTENEFLGNDEFFDETARTSTAVALKDSYLIELSDTEVHDLIQQDTSVYENLREPLYSDVDEVPAKDSTPAPNIHEVTKTNIPQVDNQEVEETKDVLDSFKEHPGESQLDDLILDEVFPDQGKTDEEVFNELNAELNSNVIPEMPLDEFDADTFKALESIEDPLFNSATYPVKEIIADDSLNEDDASFFAGLSSMESTVPLEKQTSDKPETPIEFNVTLNESIEENNFIGEPALDKTETPINIPDELPEVLEVEKHEPVVEESPAPVIKKATKREQSEDDIMTAEQFEMINKAAQLVNSNIQIDDVLKNIVDVASNLTNADRGTLYLVDKENNELWSKVAMGNEMKEIRVKIGEGISGWVAKSGEIVNIQDVKSDGRFKSDFDKSSGYETKNMLCYPIKNRKKEVVGVLQLINSERGQFSDLDHEFLNALSIHAALALENAGLVEKLLHGERVSSLGKMANFLIQDIKKPILVSKRYAEHLKTKELPPEIAQVLDMMLEQLNQVADLVQTTSSYSEGKRILHTLTVNFMETMEDFSQRMASYVQTRNCEIINNVDANINIKLDVKEFYQCYMHIVRNACDAMPDGGKIVIYSTLGNKKLTVSFKDNGLGIPDSIKDKIFEPFTSHGKKEGTGLGLSITKQIVEAHGGEVTVESALGEGATINITLPV